MNVRTLADLKAVVDALIAVHPEAYVDICYPIMRAGKRTSRLSNITSYQVVPGGPAHDLIRICVDYARSELAASSPDSGERDVNFVGPLLFLLAGYVAFAFLYPFMAAGVRG